VECRLAWVRCVTLDSRVVKTMACLAADHHHRPVAMADSDRDYEGHRRRVGSHPTKTVAVTRRCCRRRRRSRSSHSMSQAPPPVTILYLLRRRRRRRLYCQLYPDCRRLRRRVKLRRSRRRRPRRLSSYIRPGIKNSRLGCLCVGLYLCDDDDDDIVFDGPPQSLLLFLYKVMTTITIIITKKKRKKKEPSYNA